MTSVFQPQIEVLLHKLVQRTTAGGSAPVSERFAGSASRRTIDLSPYLGDGSSVRTMKSIRYPAGGWQIELVDRPDGTDGSYETLYAMAEPMDMVEIRMAHGTERSDERRLPIVMRGFVSDVRRSESAAGDGRPVRKVILSGQDYGKIWQIIQIIYLKDYIVGKAYISGFTLFEKFGVPSVLSAADFVTQVVEKVINPYITAMTPKTIQLPRKILTDVSVAAATVSPGIQNQQGTIYELLRYYGDVGPWNELFTEDREDGVYAVYRANPFIKTDGSGEKIQPEAPDPVFIDIKAQEIVSMDLTRSDANIANYYWVANQRFNLIAEPYRRQEAMASGDPTVDLGSYPNTAASIYGARVMSLETAQGGHAMSTHGSGGLAEDVARNERSAFDWMENRRRVVVDSNRDNVVLESGSINLRGDPRIKAGCYLRISRGSLTSIAYITHVSHEFVPYQGYFTSVSVERCTSFIERLKAGASPYFQEQQ